MYKTVSFRITNKTILANSVEFVIKQDRLASVEYYWLHLPLVKLACMMGTAELRGTTAASEADLAWR